MGSSAFSIKDKVAIVTGGGGGIGEGICLEFAKAGSHVVVAEINSERAKIVEKEIRELGERGLAVVTDLTKEEDVEKMVEKTVKEFGTVDILVNVATGTSQKNAKALVENMTVDQWDSYFKVDNRGTFLCCKHAGKVMLAKRKGKIINFASMVGIHGNVAGETGYGSAKGGLITFTKELALDWGKYNINVNCIAPGLILTVEAKETLTKFGVLEKATSLCALKRGGLPEDIANACIFLASEAAGYISGQTLCVDGGPIALFG